MAQLYNRNSAKSEARSLLGAWNRINMNYRRYHIKPKRHRLRKRKRFYQSLSFWTVVLASITGLMLFYFILFSPKFQVVNVTISSNEKADTKSIENLVWSHVNKKIIAIGPWSVFSKSIFIINKHKLTSNTLDNFPVIDEVTIDKKMPNTIHVRVQERKPFAVFCDAQCFFMDKNGIIFEKLFVIPEEFFTIYENTGNSLSLGSTAVNKNLVDAIDKIKKTLMNNFQVKAVEASLDDLLVVKTDEGWNAYFDPARDLDFQIDKMSHLLKDEIPSQERKNIQYIYLQYKDKAYYK